MNSLGTRLPYTPPVFDCWRQERPRNKASVGWLPYLVKLLVKVITCTYFVMTLHSPSPSLCNFRRPNEICVSWSRRGRRLITKVRGHWESGYIVIIV